GLNHGCHNRPWRDCIDLNAKLAVFDGAVACQPDDAMFACSIARLMPHPANAANRGAIHDGAMALTTHHLQHLGHTEEHAVEVNRDHPMEFLGPEIFGQVLAAFDAGIVEKSVDATEALQGLRDIGLNL